MEISFKTGHSRIFNKNTTRLRSIKRKLKTTRAINAERQETQKQPPQKLTTLKEARRFMIDCFKSVKTNENHAYTVADNLIEADYRGHYSHGMNRLQLYLDDVECGVCQPNAEPTVDFERCGTALVNGNNGFGAVIGKCCMNIAIKKAGATGIGMVVCHNSNHYGMAGYYVLQAARRGFYAISMTNTSPLMVPTRGKNSLFGTNPIACGAPGPDGDMFLLDMATTAVALGKIEINRRKNTPIPEGWALNEKGETETDPNVAYTAARLTPLGGTEKNSGYKGYGLSMMIDILAGILSGAAVGTEIRKWGLTCAKPNLGHAFIAINPNYFARNTEKRLGQLLCKVRNTEPICPTLPVLVPGDPERSHMNKVDKIGGLFYSENQMLMNERLAKKYNIKPMESTCLET